MSKNGNPRCPRDARVEPGWTAKQKVTKREQVFVLHRVGRLCSCSCRIAAWKSKVVGHSPTGFSGFGWCTGFVWVCTGIWESGVGDAVFMGPEVIIQYIDHLLLIMSYVSELCCIGYWLVVKMVSGGGDECLLSIYLLSQRALFYSVECPPCCCSGRSLVLSQAPYPASTFTLESGPSR